METVSTIETHLYQKVALGSTTETIGESLNCTNETKLIAMSWPKNVQCVTLSQLVSSSKKKHENPMNIAIIAILLRQISSISMVRIFHKTVGSRAGP